MGEDYSLGTGENESQKIVQLKASVKKYISKNVHT